ncbi:MAG: protein kinase [Ornithinimicrobium sp.]
MDEHRSDARSGGTERFIPGYDLTHEMTPRGLRGVSCGQGVRHADGLAVALTLLDVAQGTDAPARVDSALRLAAQVSRIRHEHVIRVHDVLPLSDDEGRCTAVVVATAVPDGGSLTDRLDRSGSLPLAEAITLVCPLAEALQHVHDCAVVHASITSDAVVFTHEGKPLLADVALAQIAIASPGALTGSPDALAPELVEGYAPSVESDVYAFASVVWEALTGETPGWVGARGDLEDLASEVPVGVREVLGRALSAEPDERPRLSEIAMEFRAVGHPESIRLGGDLARDVPTRIRAMAARAPTSHRAPPSRRRRTVLVAIATAALATVVAAATLASGHRDRAAELGGGGSTTTTATTDADAIATAPSTATETSTGDVAADAVPVGSATPGDSAAEPVQEWRDEIQAVLRARASAWESGDPEDLRRAHAAGSEALSADRADLVTAEAAGIRYVDLEFVADAVQIVAVEPVDSETIDSAEEVTADVTVSRGAFTVASEEGSRQIEPSSEVVQLTLRREPDGWRLWAWNPGRKSEE